MVGEPEQLAVSVTLVPAIGVVLLALSVQLGGAGRPQLTTTDEGALLPTLFDATTEYVTAPAVERVALHTAPVAVQFVQA